MGVFFPGHCETSIVKALDIIAKLIDVKAREWTAKQAQAVSGALLGHTQQSMAKEWFARQISQQAVAQLLSRAGWPTISIAIGFFESQVPGILKA